ncbi:MAG: helix-turn-helix transcriptional regulator [Bacteroidota bacterium]
MQNKLAQMSFIGKNIRKIRTVKQLNQSQFAELFGLSRASIGSYEEGRAEPKIDKIIDIAKYFSIELDLILEKELSVNEISGFKLADSKMISGNGNNLLEAKKTKAKRIIYIKHKSEKKFIKHILDDQKWKSDEIELPPTINDNSSIAFEHNDNAMDLNNNGISMSDIVFGKTTNFENIFDGYIYIIVQRDSICLRKAFVNDDKITLKAINVNFQPKIIKKDDVVAIYKITAVIKNSINHFID